MPAAPASVPQPSTRNFTSHIGKKKYRDEDDYFEQDEESAAAAAEGDSGLEYLPGPDSPPAADRRPAAAVGQSEDEDPLDAFMAGIQEEVVMQDVHFHGSSKPSGSKEKQKKENIRDDIEGEDVQEEFFRFMEENPEFGVIPEEDEAFDYDEEGNPIIHAKKAPIDPLPPIDHSDIDYDPFEKNFFTETEDIAKLSPTDVDQLRYKLGIRVTGISPPKPVSSFAHFGFDEKLIDAIRKAEYTTPTPIQAQGIPVALSGRDIIGIAKTGSGKTAAFLWPLLLHIMDQKELQPGDGPIGLICAPTRELSQQIYQEAKKFGKVYNINVVCAYGGGNMYEQIKACEEGAEIIVCTPGRLIDLVRKKATNLRRVTFLVFDEADRMFDMGFEPQVRSIANHVRPDRQTLLFSATFKKKVERLARDILVDPVRVIQGDIGEANEDITQIVEVFHEGPGKWNWLMRRLVEFTTHGSVLIFVTRKTNSEELANNLKLKDFKVGLLHGDMDQVSRNEVISKFKKLEFPILVATDVAARGLDIASIKTVINYDVARDIDTHTHRIGRTGRAGEKGTAYTLVSDKDRDFAAHLVRNLEGANQFVPQPLLDLALKNPWFQTTRFKKGEAKKLPSAGGGLGFRQRPGLGSGGGSGQAGSSAGLQASYRPPPATGPQTNRASTLRTAFSAQFKSSFVAATDTAHKTSTVSEPLPEKKPKRKQRWDV